jgi:hypothetical protein
MAKSIRFALLTLLALSLVCISTLAQVSPNNGVTNSTKNPLQIAILHWYDANLTTSFDIGLIPAALAFDGENMWAGAGLFKDELIKLRANDGKVLGAFTILAPFALVFDGSNIWVANLNVGDTGNNVTKVRASDGKVLGTFTPDGGFGVFGVSKL